MNGRRWLAPEVVQTSSMDCGPASLKCLLEGFGIPASYGRLREACQTQVDGTSIDTLEEVAQQLGLQADQVLLPADHVARRGGADGALLAVVDLPDQGTHFVVVWRRVGRWVQVMDPGAGRRWLPAAALRAQLHVHEAEVDAATWRDWAAGADNAAALAARGQALGAGRATALTLVADARADAGWLALATLDAALRLVQSLVDAGALRRGAEARRALVALCAQVARQPKAARALIAEEAWSVGPAADGRLRVRGAVLLQVSGRRSDGPLDARQPPESAELRAVLTERPASLAGILWTTLRNDGRWTVPALALACAVATAGVALELLLLRGLFDLPAVLGGSGPHGGAVLALLALLAVLLLLELPVAREAQRLGRHLELRLRAALLERLPRLHDRYFQSRPISDMADRSHGIQLVRGMPATALAALQAVVDLALTSAGIVWLAPAATPWAAALVAVVLGVPLLAMPLLSERDLRLRTQSAALAGFYLDALMGLVPVRAHRAERAVQREHEALLVGWARSLRGWVRGSLAAEGLQGLLAIALAAALLLVHFRAQGGVGGADLLLVYWVLKLPALGQRLADLSQAVPAQRNALRRLLEPLSAPVTERPAAAVPRTRAAVAVQIDGGLVQAGGHAILQDLDLRIAAGEQVAVVGLSGAGKSTLVGLLMGWHRLTAGTLRLDGQVAGAAEVEALRPQVAWVDPAVQLWNRSLLDNLLYASEDAALPRLSAVLGRAQLGDVAARLPQGLQGLLGEGGGSLSGGEGQRVRLARALMQTDTRLVLLDEPFRGLDRARRHQLLAEARLWWSGRTMLAVTHDVSETLAFDRVLVVDGGRLVEDGRPAELARRDSRYRALLLAEDALRRRAWVDAGPVAWRRLHLVDGQLHEAAADGRSGAVHPLGAPRSAPLPPSPPGRPARAAGGLAPLHVVERQP